MKRLAIITTHPIQYYAPVFKLLQAQRNISIRVFYTLGRGAGSKFDPGFGKNVKWDIPLLDGYDYEWADNTASDPGTRRFMGIVTPGLISRVNEWKPDAVLVYGWAYHSHLKAIRYFKNKIPVYFRGDSTLLIEPKGVKGVLKYIFLRWVYSHVDHAFCVGANNRRYYEKFGLKDEQLSFAPHAIDNDRFKIDHSDEVSELRLSLKIKEDDTLILFAGKFEPVKNIELLLSAFVYLNRPGAHLLLVGNGINEQALKAQATASKVTDNIHFLDFKNQSFMPVLYQAADLFCLPSISESWGLSINEAMACGKAILVSDKVGCAADLVKEGVNGCIFKTGDMNGLTEKLRLLTNNKNVLLKYGGQSKIIIGSWNFTNIALAIEKKVLHETNRPY